MDNFSMGLVRWILLDKLVTIILVIGVISLKILPQAKLVSNTKSWALLGGVIPAWSSAAFWPRNEAITSEQYVQFIDEMNRQLQCVRPVLSREEAQFFTTPDLNQSLKGMYMEKGSWRGWEGDQKKRWWVRVIRMPYTCILNYHWTNLTNKERKWKTWAS